MIRVDPPKATDRNRTGNLQITNQVLCQLSYGGVVCRVLDAADRSGGGVLLSDRHREDGGIGGGDAGES